MNLSFAQHFKKESVLSAVFVYRWRWRVAIVFSSLCAAVGGLFSLLFLKGFVDEMTGTAPLWPLPPAGSIFAGFACMVASQLLTQLTNYLGSREALYSQRVLADKVYHKMIELKVDTLTSRPIGEIVALYATDVPGATVFLDQTLPAGSTTLFPLLLAPMIIWKIYHFSFSLVVVFIIAISTFNTLLALRQARFFYKFKALASERIGIVTEWIQNIRALRILGLTSAFESKIKAKRMNETENRVRMVTNGQVMNSVSSSFTFLLNTSVLAAMTYDVNYRLTPGEILGLLWILGVFLTRPFRQMPWFFTFVFDSWTSVVRLQEFLEIEPEVFRGRSLTEVPQPTPVTREIEGTALEIQNLNLRIGAADILKDISFTVLKGEFVAFVGAVGSGKSLLMLSLLGETHCTWKSYRLFGYPLNPDGSRPPEGFFSYVPQEGFLISASLRDNVHFDYESLSQMDPNVLESLEKAQFSEDLRRTEMTLDQAIGERGVNLSGGQRQRVSIGRAHFNTAPIVMLDDSLSAVDVDTEEKIIKDLLQGEWRSKTRLLVTHRLEILKKVHRIIFLDRGQIRAQGSFSELLKQCQEFRDFVATVNNKPTGEGHVPHPG